MATAPTTPFTYITLLTPYALLKVQSSVSLTQDISDTPSFAFGKLSQVAPGSALTLGTNYCIQVSISSPIKTVQIENTAFYLVREDSLRFSETTPPALP